MLTFEEKLTIISSFPQLKEKKVSLGRINFQYEESKSDKKNVVYHLHPNGNGFVYAGELSGYELGPKGMVNIRDFTKEQLTTIIERSIASLSPKSTVEAAIIGEEKEEKWVDENQHTLILIFEDEMWNIYAGLNLDATFSTYEEATSYLEEEGFTQL
ncbi:hypothetical protein WAK64_10730 [Bacillus spongiae]|uniref:Uncharacterized protein n=1 Tax=Bacillus spongiae TaxID=2683610 RepID=A0ABU8HDU7_9BACI